MGKYRVEALLIACGTALLGLFVSNGLTGFSSDSRTVNVKGLAQKEVLADKVTCPLVYKELGNDLPSLHSLLNKKNEQVVEFLIERGIPREDIAIKAPEVVDLLADRYNSQPVSERYNATSVIIVTSSEVDKVRKMIEQQSELMKVGIAIVPDDYNYRTSYDFTALNEIKPSMIEEATANAREAAEKFAEDSDSKLGKIKRAYQGQFTISNRDAYTPHIKSVRVVTTIDYFLED